ncbi:hypothetical protein BLNAU_1455 [Blattamonas nauphoetae]|uniref:Uncharacterized protein n=1 Tax=Blattamonas nauphoetae TaxID=2049346 RepID=A0ABQ9YI33_9EUKA|nr:hypothetical protein BLNAU_1455 [Blattamonas nauphoetae]
MTEVEPRVFARMIAYVREYKAKIESSSRTSPLDTQLRTFCVRLATTRPALLASLIGNSHFQIMNWLVRSLFDTARVVPSTENNHRCLSFGTDTADWMSFLGVLGTITRQETKKAQNSGTLSLHTSVLGLLILLSASTDIVLSDAAVSEIARGCGLSEGEVKTILFETPLSFPIPPDWVLETHVPNADDTPSLCASIGSTLLKFNDADGEHRPDPSKSILTVTLVVDTLRCLVNVFNTVNPTFIRHHSFSPSLTQTPTMPSFWKTQPIATTLPALRTFTVQLIMLASSALIQQIQIGLRHNLSVGVATVLHLLPHLDAASKPSALVFIMNQLSNFRGNNDQYLSKICRVVLDLALTDSYRTPTTLLRLTKLCVSHSLPARPSSSFGGGFLPFQNELAASISDQMDTAEGEQRWMLFTELICTSTNLSTDTIETMLMEAENDDQMRVVLSSLALGAVQLGSQGVSFSDEVQTRLLRCAGQTNNVELASHAWNWIEKGCQLPTRQSMHGRMVGRMEASEEMMTLLLKVLGDLNNEGRGGESEGDDEGAAEREKERKTILQCCLQILSRQIIWMNADSTPFVPLLISLMQNEDVQTVCTLIEVFVGISTRTSNSANPISLSTIDVPVASQSSPATQSLLSFVSSFLLKSILALPQSSLSTINPFMAQLQPLDEPVELTIRRMWQNLEGEKSGTVESLVKRMIEIGCELLESSGQVRKNQSSPLHHVTSLHTSQSNPNYSPNQIWIALFTALFSSPNRLFTIDALCRLSEVLNRLVEAMLKTGSDCVSGEDEYMSVQSFFSTISSTLMHPLVAVARKEWAARPSLSNLLHSTATLLIRHDSSLPELIRYADQMYQGKQRGDGRERRNPHTCRQQHPSRVDLIMCTLAEEGVEDRVDMSAHHNQRYLQFLGANAIPMLTGTGMFGHPVAGFPFGNAQMANPLGNPQFGDHSVSLFVALIDHTATDEGLSLHSSTKPTQNTLEGWTRLQLADLSGGSTSEHNDCSPFLNWNEEEPESEHEKIIVFRSLVATVKLQPELDESLVVKALKFLEYVVPWGEDSADAFLNSLASNFDDFLKDFVQSIMVLISCTNRVIITETMRVVQNLILNCTAKFQLTLVKADLIPQLIITLNPQSLWLSDYEHIHTYLIHVITNSFWLSTPAGLTQLKDEDENELQSVHETVLKQVLAPSEKYIWHLCTNRFSIIDGEQSKYFLALLARILEISPYYQPPLDFVVVPPREWNKQGREIRRSGATIIRCLRMEGIEDVFEEKLFNDKNSHFGEYLLDKLLELSFGRNRQEPANILCASAVCFDTPKLPFQHRLCSLSPQSPIVLHSLSLIHSSHSSHSLTTHTLPLPSASPSPPTPSHSPLPLPHHPHPPTPLCLSLTTHALQLPSASPLTTHTLPLPSASPSPPTLGVARAAGCSFEVHAILASTVFLLRFL